MSALAPNPIACLLSSWSIESFLDEYKEVDSNKPSLLQTLRPDETVLSALQTLSERGVLSAPVVAAAGADIYRGFFGVVDIVKALFSSDNVQLAMIRHQVGPEPGQAGGELMKLDASAWTDLTAETLGAQAVEHRQLAAWLLQRQLLQRITCSRPLSAAPPPPAPTTRRTGAAAVVVAWSRRRRRHE